MIKDLRHYIQIITKTAQTNVTDSMKQECYRPCRGAMRQCSKPGERCSDGLVGCLNPSVDVWLGGGVFVVGSCV